MINSTFFRVLICTALLSFFLFTCSRCKDDTSQEAVSNCFGSKTTAVQEYLHWETHQSVRNIAEGICDFSIVNSSDRLTFRIARISIPVRPLFGSRTIRPRTANIILRPGERFDGQFNLDAGDRSQNAYPQMESIQITCAED